MDGQDAGHFYQRHGSWSDPGIYSGMFDAIPRKIASVTRTVQGLLVHDYFGVHLYDNPPENVLTASRQTLPVSERLSMLHAGFGMPLTEARETAQRSVGTCRDFALLTCAILRHQGVPARVRCGFARYFRPPLYEDHWICQYWDKQSCAWGIADAQLDPAHRDHLAIEFDHNDVPSDQFLFPWQVWLRHRADPEALMAFGHGESVGTWFLRVNLARDALALAKSEVSAWDSWRAQTKAQKHDTPEMFAQCDRLADMGRLLAQAEQVDQAMIDSVIAGLEVPPWRQ